MNGWLETKYSLTEILIILTGLGAFLGLIRKVFAMGDLVVDSDPNDNVDYGVKFENGKLVAKGGLKNMGLTNTTELDGKIVVDALIDLIEKAIPGDQTAEAAKLKALAHMALDAQSKPAA